MPIARVTLLVYLAACVDAPVRTYESATITIATWNAERVFDARCETTRCGASEAEDVHTEAEVGADVVRVARGVRGLDADVVVLPEVENAALARRIADTAGGVATAVIGESGPGTIDVAVLSRFPVLEVIEHRPRLDIPGRDERSTRVLLEVRVDAGARELIVIAAHFKSRLRDDAERRHAEARATAAIAHDTAAAHPSAVVLVAGDLNDAPGSITLDALEHEGALDLLTRLLSASEAYTFGTGSRRTLIDHLLCVPRTFVSTLAVSVVRNDGETYGGSDHAALRAQLTTR